METENGKTSTKRENNRGGVLFDYRGRLHVVPFRAGDGLEQLRRLLGCRWVEAVRLRGPLAGLSMWCDEEGKLLDHFANVPASLLYRYLCGGDYMAGRVLILADNAEGETLPLTDKQRALVLRITAAAFRYARERGDRVEATGPHMEFVAL